MRYKIFSLAFFLLLSICFSLSQAFATESISGLVRDALTGAPLAGAVVTCGSEVTHTDEDGVFSLSSQQPVVQVRAAGYGRVQVPADNSAEIHLEPFSPKALYLSFYGIGEPILRDPALQLIEDTELNSLVIDVKGDRGMVVYPSDVPLARDIGAQRVVTVRKPLPLLESLKKRGIYTIARIVVFKDNLLAEHSPHLAVKDSKGNAWHDGEGLSWVDPFAEEVWEYNINLAEEAARMGFDEIQFDYVRFPDKTGLEFSRENSEQNRVSAITGFLSAARKRLAPYNVFLSADIFGYVCWNRNDTSIGQQLEELVPVLDYISPMLYPSGFTFGVGEYRNPVKNPYEIISLTLKKAQSRTGASSVKFRPWLQAFRDYAFDRRHFNEDEIQAQISASDHFGSNGWMLWNPRNVYRSTGLERIEIEAKVDMPYPQEQGASVPDSEMM